MIGNTRIPGTLIESGSIPTTALGGGVVSSSAQIISSLPAGAISSSAQVQLNQVSGTTFSNNNFTFPQTVNVTGGVTASAGFFGTASYALTPAGTAGSSGTSGTAGSAGTSGTAGSSGSTGTSGSAGTAGSSGTSGSSGSAGSSGSSGATGATGSSGSSGSSGATGASGSSGSAGSAGSSGTSGTRGSSGSSGTTGANGANGSSGSSGTTGANGAPGSSGSSGTSASVTINNNTDNYLVTATGTTNTLNGEANLTFNGSTFSVVGGSSTANFRNTTATSVSNLQLANDASTNAAGIALFGSTYTPSAQYRADGMYVYSNRAGGVTVHAEGAYPVYLATNSVLRLLIEGGGNVGIGTTSAYNTLALNGTLGVNGTTNSSTIYMYDGYVDANSSYFQIPQSRIRLDSSATGAIDQAPVAMFLHNENGTNNTWVKLSMGGREEPTAGNTVSWAGIAARKTAGTYGAWAQGELHLWTKNNAAFSTGLMINSAGSVGIGTTSPNVTFQVNSTITGGGLAHFVSTGAESSITYRINSAATGTGWVTGNANNAYFIYSYTLGSQAVSILSSGYVGIGSTGPGVSLQVHGNGSANSYRGVIRIINTDSTAQWGGLSFPDGVATDSAANNYYFIGRGQTIADRNFSFHIPRAADYGSGAQPKFIFASTGADNLFTVEASTGTTYVKGSVGIGTTSPSQQLHITAYARMLGFVIDETGGTRSAFFGYEKNWIGSGTSNSLAIAAETSNSLKFYTNGSATLRMMINTNGNLMMGSATGPSAVAWPGAAVFGSDGGNKVIIGRVVSTYTGAVVGGHNDALTDWADLSIAGKTNIIFRESEVEKMRLSSGNLGIGTTAPATKFNINQGAGGTDGTFVVRIGGTNNYASLELGIFGDYDGMITSYGNDLRYYAGHWRTVGNTASEDHKHMWFTSKTSSTDWSTAKMILNHDGNLGIGTSSVGYKLQINSGDDIILRINKTTAGWSGYTNSHGLQIVAANMTGGSYLAGLEFGKALSSYNSAHIDYVHVSDGSTSNYMALGLWNADQILNIFASGNVGIGTTGNPAYKLRVEGAIYSSNDIIAYSDARAKENVVTLDNALNKVTNLRGVYYTRKDDEQKKRNVGVIAQEVLDVVPELVSYSEASDEYAVKYQNITALLIEAIKELKADNDDLRSLITELQNK